ncbi:MAG: twin-arginine translocase TatA/TatE family subunit [Actinobacteria bacterium]|nr:twin-arginine translocase TatA/TatE family subunit [Actinomycetota bacterium]
MSTLAFLSSTELIWVAVLAVVVFGGSQLPKLARNLGRAQKELQKGLAEGAAEVDRAAEADRADDSSD